MTLGEQRRKALELLAPPPSRHDHSGVVRPLSYSRPHQAGTTTPMAASRASRGSASSKPSIIGVLAERHARHLAERAQTLQDALKPMHTDPSTIWVICYQRTTQEPFQRDFASSRDVVVLGGIEAVESNGLVADESRVAVHRRRVHAPCIEISLGARDEEAAFHTTLPVRPLGHSSSTRLLCRMVKRDRGRLLP